MKQLKILGCLLFIGCSSPYQGGRVDNEPLQQITTPKIILYKNATLTQRALFEAEGRVLAIKKYNRETSDILPYDIALGWKDMSEDATVEQLDIWQGQRRYYYKPHHQPFPLGKVARQSSNMHIIPQNPLVQKKLSQISVNDRIIIKGRLVDVKMADGSFLKTSLKRNDMWDGACEIIFAETVEIVP